MKQKKVTLKDHGIETEYELPGLKVLHFERLTMPEPLYFNRISAPEKWVGDD